MEVFEKGLVSIIIPVFNRDSLLFETLNSILLQSYQNWECIIIDDGSSDSSYHVAQQFVYRDNRFKVFHRPFFKRKGANTCRNYGFTLSKGEYIQWFDSDDLLATEMIEEKILTFQRTNADIVVCGASFFSDSNKLMRNPINSIEPQTNNPAFEYFAGKFWFGTPQAMIKRNVLIGLPYIFNKKLKRNQESELYVRILLKGFKISYVNEILIFIRLHVNSISGNYAMMSNEGKIALDLDAYFSMFLSFKNANKLSDEVLSYFSTYFFKSLGKIKSDILVLFKLFIFGIKHNLFPSRYLGTKVFIYRLFKL
jgi:glycosyltransferase involved in cell wall biosynthesis